MPTYEYECKDCGFIFEKEHSITSEPLKDCPECHGTLSRLISKNVNVIFKGSGFYITDHRSEDYKKKAKEEGSKVTAPSESSSKDSKKD